MRTAEKYKVIATNHDPAGALAIAPVIRRLKDDSIIEVIVIGTGYSKEIFSTQGIDFKDDSDYGSSNISDLAEMIVEAECPDLILMGTSRVNSLEKELTLVARRRSIKTLAVQDYWSNYWKRFSNLETNKRLIYLPDKIAVMDDLAKKEMLMESFPEECLVVTGNPHFDDIQHSIKGYDFQKIEMMRKHLAIKENSVVISFISETQAEDFGTASDKPGSLGRYIGYTEVDALAGLVSAMNVICKAHKDEPFTIVVKLHPREEKAPFLPDKLPENLDFTVVKAYDPRGIVAISKVVVGMTSALLFEAGLMGKPAISFQPNLIGPDIAIGDRLGISSLAKSGRELLNLLQKALVLKKSIHKKDVFNSLIDGRSTERVVKEIYRLLGVGG